MIELHKDVTQNVLKMLQRIVDWSNQMKGLTGSEFDTYRTYVQTIANELNRLSSSLEAALKILEAPKKKEQVNENITDNSGNGGIVPSQEEGSGTQKQEEQGEKPV